LLLGPGRLHTHCAAAAAGEVAGLELLGWLWDLLEEMRECERARVLQVRPFPRAGWELAGITLAPRGAS
jgi:hypothetical protein